MDENTLAIPDNATGTVWYCHETNNLLIRYVIHWGEFAASIENEYDPEFCPAMEYNFSYIGVL